MEVIEILVFRNKKDRKPNNERNKMKYKNRITAMTVLKDGEALISETATLISIVDDGAGEYLSISQSGGNSVNAINVDPGEWIELRSSIDQMFTEMKKNKL
jgi:hypothetical protein